MNKIERDTAHLLEAFDEAGVAAPIVEALAGYRVPSSGMIYIEGSNAFNAYAQACKQTAEAEPLTERKIEQPKKIGQAGKMVIDLINSSVEGPKNTKYPFHWTDKLIGTCKSAEVNYIRSIRNAGHDYINNLYVDDEGETVLFQKSFGEESAMSFKPISVAGIDYAPGTIFSVWQTEDAFGEPVSGQFFESEVYPLGHIAALRPMRLSYLALSERDKDRRQTIKGFDYYHVDSALRHLDVRDVSAFMPSAGVLKQVLQERPRLAGVMGRAWQREAEAQTKAA